MTVVGGETYSGLAICNQDVIWRSLKQKDFVLTREFFDNSVEIAEGGTFQHEDQPRFHNMSDAVLAHSSTPEAPSSWCHRPTSMRLWQTCVQRHASSYHTRSPSIPLRNSHDFCRDVAMMLLNSLWWRVTMWEGDCRSESWIIYFETAWKMTVFGRECPRGNQIKPTVGNSENVFDGG